MTFERLLKGGWERAENIERYLQEGGDINRRVDSGHSLLHLAAQNSRADLIRFLLARGADINARGYNGYTPLHLAVAEDVCTESRDGRRATELPLTQALLEFGPDETVKDNDGETPRDIAVTYGPKETALYDALPRRRGPST